MLMHFLLASFLQNGHVSRKHVNVVDLEKSIGHVPLRPGVPCSRSIREPRSLSQRRNVSFQFFYSGENAGSAKEDIIK